MTILIHLWLIPAIFLFGTAWDQNSTWRDRGRAAVLTLVWPITLPAIWLLNKLTR